MKAVLRDIQTGKFVRDFMQENAVGQPSLQRRPAASTTNTRSRKVGEKLLRAMMPWIAKGKMVDRSRN